MKHKIHETQDRCNKKEEKPVGGIIMASFIDTDIGSDVDDSIALLYALSCLNIGGITTVHGCARKRAQIARKILKSVGPNLPSPSKKFAEFPPIPPIHAGSDKPLCLEKIYLYGHEGKGILDGKEPAPVNGAAEFLARTIQSGDDIFCIAPLTTIARAIQLNPFFSSRLERIYLMGGIVKTDNGYAPDKTSHNFKVDPHATDIIFANQAPISVLTTEIGKKVYLTLDDFNSLPQGKPFDYIRANAACFFSARGQDRAYMYDPLTIMLKSKPEFFSLETRGSITITTGVDAPKAKTHLLETLINAFIT